MKANLDSYTYTLLLKYKQSTHDTSRKGESQDLKFLEQDLWLQDTVVFDRVVKLNGTWQINLVFVHYQNPFLLIKRFIKTQISEKKACLEAYYMKKVAAKDQRGNLILEKHKLNLNYN